MKFNSKSIIKACSDDNYRPVLQHVCVRYFPEPQDASKMKGAFMEATDGRRLVRVEVEIEDTDVVAKDGTATVLIHRDIIKGALNIQGKPTKGPFYIQITDEAFKYSNSISIPRKNEFTWPDTRQVWPTPNKIGTGFSINPMFIHECAEACGILDGQSSPIVTVFANNMLDPYIMSGHCGKAIIMPGRISTLLGGIVACGVDAASPESGRLCEQLDGLIKDFMAGYESERSSDGIEPRGSLPTVLAMGWDYARRQRRMEESN